MRISRIREKYCGHYFFSQNFQASSQSIFIFNIFLATPVTSKLPLIIFILNSVHPSHTTHMYLHILISATFVFSFFFTQVLLICHHDSQQFYKASVKLIPTSFSHFQFYYSHPSQSLHVLAKL